MQCPPEDSSDEEWGSAEQRYCDGLEEFIGDAPRAEDRPLDEDIRLDGVMRDMFTQVDATMEGNELGSSDAD